MITRVLVFGGGSAGLIAALSLKKVNPALSVQVIRSKALGVIGVGEGTTVVFPTYFHTVLRVSEKRFFDEVAPTWKLGLKFKWGPAQLLLPVRCPLRPARRPASQS